MKKSLMVLLLLISIFCRAQRLEGISEIKIDKTLSEIIQIFQQRFNVLPETINDNNYAKYSDDLTPFSDNSKVSLFKLEGKSILSWPVITWPSAISTYKDLDSIDIFYVAKFPIGNIFVKTMLLLFKNEKLQVIEMGESPELTEAIKSKYPTTDTLNKEEEITCVYVASGVPQKKQSYIVSSKWQNELLTAESIFYLGYDSKCKEMLDSHIGFTSNEFLKFIENKKLANEKAGKDKMQTDIQSITNSL